MKYAEVLESYLIPAEEGLFDKMREKNKENRINRYFNGLISSIKEFFIHNGCRSKYIEFYHNKNNVLAKYNVKTTPKDDQDIIKETLDEMVNTYDDLSIRTQTEGSLKIITFIFKNT